jgi:ankyrin repeat protein
MNGKKLKSLNHIASPYEWETLTDKDVYDFLSKDPESLSRKDDTNAFPLHYSVISGAKINVVRLIYYLYPNAIYNKSEGYLPIHYAADDPKRHYLVEFLAKMYPESLLIKNNNSQTPIDLVKIEKNHDLENKLYKIFYKYSLRETRGDN